MKHVDLLEIQLTFCGESVAEIRSDALTVPILIGRDPSAAWRPPAADRTMPARAAVLQLHGGRPTLKAEPGATFRLNAVVTRERALLPGDRIAIGDCELVAKTAKIRRTYAPFHRLEPLVSERRGVFVDLKGEDFSVGSGEQANLCLADDTVSHHHAMLSMRGDGCWVKDAASRNGTFVNGQRLGGKERLLHDGDILAFGPFEYRFLDRAVSHVRTSTAKSVLIALTTLLVASGGWWLYYSNTPDATQYMIVASKLVANEQFDDAERILQEAGQARLADENDALLCRMRDLFAVMRTTAESWMAFKENLAQSRFAAAANQIGQLALDNPGNWNWNEETVDERLNEARETVALLRLAMSFWRARNDSVLSDEMRKMLAAERRKWKIDRPEFAHDEREWMQSLKQHLLTSAAGFDENEALYAALTNETERLARGETNPKAVRALAETTATTSGGHVRTVAHQMLEPLDKLEKDRLMLEADAQALAEFDGAGYSGRMLVTTPDDCTFSPSLMRCQTRNVERRRELDLASLQIRAMLKRLVVYGISAKTDPASLVAFEDDTRIERALRCEFLTAKHPPRLDRTMPVDDAYDRLFGYEFLYSYTEEGYFVYPQEVNHERLNLAGFKPEIYLLNALNEELLADLKMLAGKEFDCVRTGAFAARIKRLEDWSRRIGAIRDRFDQIADDPEEATTRRGILARAAALYLTPHAETSKTDWDDLRRRIVWQRENVRSRLDEIDPTKPEKTREVINWIMDRGIPGSPAVRKAWNYR